MQADSFSPSDLIEIGTILVYIFVVYFYIFWSWARVCQHTLPNQTEAPVSGFDLELDSIFFSLYTLWPLDGPISTPISTTHYCIEDHGQQSQQWPTEFHDIKLHNMTVPQHSS